LAGNFGGKFWREILAGNFGGKFWRQILVTIFGGKKISRWRAGSEAGGRKLVNYFWRSNFCDGYTIVGT
jgi:hypothetical protein